MRTESKCNSLERPNTLSCTNLELHHRHALVDSDGADVGLNALHVLKAAHMVFLGDKWWLCSVCVCGGGLNECGGRYGGRVENGVRRHNRKRERITDTSTETQNLEEYKVTTKEIRTFN